MLPRDFRKLQVGKLERQESRGWNQPDDRMLEFCFGFPEDPWELYE